MRKAMCEKGEQKPKGGDWWQDIDLKALAWQLKKAGKMKGPPMIPRWSRTHVWLIRASTTILLWTCIIQLTAIGELWHPRLLRGFPACLHHFSSSAQSSEIPVFEQPIHSRRTISPFRNYKSHGYLIVSCNGGLNQMRAAICDMVTIARFLNVTLVVPQLDKTSFWADPSDFEDIFDVNYFVKSLRDEVRIVRKLPTKYRRKLEERSILSMPPISWSNHSYYLNQILPLFRSHKVLHLNKTDARLANNGLPIELQKLRCRVNYDALRFTPRIEEVGRKIVSILRANGRFVVLHLRYEMDMLAFSGCTEGCTNAEVEELTRMRFAYPWWKEKVIVSDQKRRDGLCPLTPEETALVLKALGFDRHTQIYIAAGEIYGGEKRMALLRSAFPNIVKKEMLLSPQELKPFVNRSSQMAALDYLVSVASDVFIPTYDGNMAKVVEGHRRFSGFRKSILLDRKQLVQLFDRYNNGTLEWDEFSLAVKQAHANHTGAPKPRKIISDKPKEEDYFYANPQECLPQPGNSPQQLISELM